MTEAGLRRRAPNFIDRETVIAAALQVFAERGFNGASMRGIAAVAETSQSNLYNYFDSKDGLLKFVLEATGRELADALEAAEAEAGEPPADRLVAAVTAYIRFVVAKPSASTVGITEFRYLSGDDRASVIQERDRTETVFRRIVEAGTRAGDFDVADEGFATRALVTLCNSMSGWYRPNGRLSPDDIIVRQVDLALGLVRSPRRH
ncbi:TetR/AcrR family transcriptional regulator [Brevibacterium jeotgali]|uniref:Transcriptional regulator, TetR family n=1 Tax=Brevibacterium jeotgali TaxID=1262550 RepID=A0A2H1L1R3_9MICO|nr:TetR/AcrR family transcriptional regulator [Brevibacterium jeotgali]TWC01870.1 TetR family transcriptional regulator [Brevibacterium jeotgali]SMY10779.1 transcriptional regulator, TetR family [Brevibacterium jeotgali]